MRETVSRMGTMRPRFMNRRIQRDAVSDPLTGIDPRRNGGGQSRRTLGVVVLVGHLCAVWLPAGATDVERSTLSFNRDIRPILSDACFFCHGPDSEHRQAGLRLDVEEQAVADAIVPGDAEASELFARIIDEDPDLRMPPPESGKRLTGDEIDRIRRWIDEGATYEPHWAYVPPRDVPAPAVENPEWGRDAIDRWLWDAIRRQGLRPSPPADWTTLLRRVSFDLTGLPPAPAEVDDFLADPSEEAYAAFVDRRLASPAYGERMAMYWLDLVRYADTVGYHGDQDHNISPYRDYVIDAFNRNLPLDRFTHEQLAGDLLPDASIDTRVASGYNRLLQTSHEGGVQPKEYLAIYAADRVRNVSAVWMGATVGCAQCHDHKYDPYTIEDFYRLAAYFADVDESRHFREGSNSLPTKRPPEIEVLPRWQRELAESLAAELETATDPRHRDELGERLRAIDASKRMTMITEPIAPREIRVLPRGNWLDDSGSLVTPAVPAFLGGSETAAGEESGRRRTRQDLAHWLTDAETGVGTMTARVFANRLWYLLFGRGLSASLEDFGGQGEPPNHPELLDRLALDFVDGGWDVKRMLRRMVLTRAYRQSSVATSEQLARDPDNRWFARQSRYRLPAESVRDHLLASAGLLVGGVGGASIRPAQPIGYYRHLNFPTRSYLPDQDARRYRRGVYIHWQRQFLHPMLRALDAPSREECTAARPRSNTPLEALVLLNDPTMVEAAVALAVRMAKDASAAVDDATDRRLAQVFRLATARLPRQSELRALRELWVAETEHYRRDPADAEALLDEFSVVTGTAEIPDPVAVAAWTSVARAVFNLHETVTRD